MLRLYPLYIGLLSLLVVSCGSEPASISTARFPDFNTFIVHADTVRAAQANQALEVMGVVTSNETARPAFKIGGVVTTMLVAENDEVRKGQLIGRLNLTEIDAQVAQSDLAVEKAQRDLRRVTALYQDSVATQEQYDNAQTGLAVAQRQRDIARFNRQYSQVFAPISGRVIRKLVNSGEVVGPGQAVCVIQGNRGDDWQVSAALTDSDWALVRQGDRAEVVLDAYPDLTIPATVSEVGTVVQADGGTFPISLQLAANRARLAAGLIARVRLLPRASNEQQLLIPLTAIVRADGHRGTVFVPDADSTARLRSVGLGPIRGTAIVVNSGLKAGDLIITDGAAWLRSGDRIRLASY